MENIESTNKTNNEKKVITEVIVPINKKSVTINGLNIRSITNDSIVSPTQHNQSHIGTSEFSNFSPSEQDSTLNIFPHKSSHNKRVKFSKANHKQPLSNLS